MDMSRKLLSGLIIFSALSGLAQNGFDSNVVSYNKFGITVKDSYLWLEDVESEKTRAWLAKQEERKWELIKKSARSRFEYILNVSEDIQTSHEDGYIFKVEQLQSLPPILTYEKSDEGSFTTINFKDFKRSRSDVPQIVSSAKAPDLPYLVLALAHHGSDWLELIIYDLDEHKVINRLEGLISSWMVFKKKGFFYTRYDKPENEVTSSRTNKRICFHKFQTKQEADIVVFQNPDPTTRRTFSVNNLGSDRVMVSYPFKWKGQWKSALSVLDISTGPYMPKPFLIYDSDNILDFDVVRKDGNNLYFHTNFNSPNYHIIVCNTDSLNDYRTFVQESEAVLIDTEYLGKETYGLTYFDPARGLYSGAVVNTFGKSKMISLPKGATISFERKTDATAYAYMNTYYLDPKPFTLSLNDFTLTKRSWKSIRTKNTYKVELVFYENDQGMKVPIQVIYADHVLKDGKNPLFIRVYGGYGTVKTPHFSWENHFILENGGILAYPVIRGSGNMGSKLALEGRGLKKQNTISDVIDASEFLIKEGYSSPDMLFLEGGSHGGFVVVEAAIQRPDLFKGIFAYAGLYDLVRSSSFTTGSHLLNLDEFGDPSDSVSFRNLHRLSPLHQLKKGVNYPSFFLLAGMNDTRVPPSNSWRFTAELNDKSANSFNLLHMTNGGHSVINYRGEFREILGLKFEFIKELTGKKMWLK